MSIETKFTDIHDWIPELIEAHDHREPYTQRIGTTTYTARHITHVPSLLDQLRGATAPTSTGDSTGPGGFTSQPAAHLEALDVLVRIDIKASRWIRDLGEDDPATTEDCLRLLHGLHASAHRCGPRRRGKACCTAHAIEHDVRSWWTAARVMTGWDTAAWRPNNTCPACDHRGGLRVRLDGALCIHCHETWTTDTIGVLAEHIRHENGEDATPDTVSA